jgi:uncharacterized membrane protein YqjE
MPTLVHGRIPAIPRPMSSIETFQAAARRPPHAQEVMMRAQDPWTQNTAVPNEPSLGELFSELSQETSQLVRQEVRLATAELTEKANKAGRNIAFIAGGGLVAYTGVLALVAALILVLSNWMAPWLAALIVGVLFVAVAAVLINSGLNELKQLNPKPQKTMATLREDKEWLTRQLN